MELWQWLRTSCESGWKRHARFLAWSWGIGIAVCGLAAVAGEGLHYYTDFREGGGRYGGIMTLVSGFCLLVAGWSLLIPARRAMRTDGRRRETLGWLLGAVGGIVLAFDEIV